MNTKSEIIELFEKYREAPGTPYEEKGFLNFLIIEPPKGGVNNSFKALHRRNKFFDELEMKYGFCFAISDLEKQWSLNEFVDRIEKKVANNAAERKFVAKRVQAAKSGIGSTVLISMLIAIVLGYTIFPLSMIIAGYTNIFLFKLAAPALWMFLTFLVYKFYSREIKHYKKLQERIHYAGN